MCEFLWGEDYGELLPEGVGKIGENVLVGGRRLVWVSNNTMSSFLVSTPVFNCV